MSISKIQREVNNKKISGPSLKFERLKTVTKSNKIVIKSKPLAKQLIKTSNTQVVYELHCPSSLLKNSD